MTEFNRKQGTDVEIALGDLKGYFLRFAKPKEKHRLGAECELFGLFEKTGQPIPYFGKQGIEGVLNGFVEKFRWTKKEEKGHVIALERGGDFITLEPGAQVELSASPVRTLNEVEKQIKTFHQEIKAIGMDLGIVWLSVGTQPLAKAGEMPWVPKARYEIMRRYLAAHGSRSHDMMQRTATNQFNVDFESEGDALEVMKIVFRLAPFAITAFANSPLFEGRVTGYQSYRNHIWHGTDADRSGLIQIFAEGNGSLDDYLDYVLDVPAFFIIRQNEWIPLEGITFRQYLEKGFGFYRATLEDFNLHLTGIFPECRIKDHIEIRGLDAQAPQFIMAAFAFWKGILETLDTRSAALDLVKDLTWPELKELYRDLPHQGLNVHVGACSAGEISRKLFEIALFGLSSTSRGSGQSADRIYLERFFHEYAGISKTPAEDVLANWSRLNSGKWLSAFERCLV
ncbi:MAG: glutamate--cysteine ligase [Candidatus Omnitrophica bacterium]|nr:glutamate--cysteine ligase [Candidatus Omnitrophota bacterium]